MSILFITLGHQKMAKVSIPLHHVLSQHYLWRAEPTAAAAAAGHQASIVRVSKPSKHVANNIKLVKADEKLVVTGRTESKKRKKFSCSLSKWEFAVGFGKQQKRKITVDLQIRVRIRTHFLYIHGSDMRYVEGARERRKSWFIELLLYYLQIIWMTKQTSKMYFISVLGLYGEQQKKIKRAIRVDIWGVEEVT